MSRLTQAFVVFLCSVGVVTHYMQRHIEFTPRVGQAHRQVLESPRIYICYYYVLGAARRLVVPIKERHFEAANNYDEIIMPPKHAGIYLNHYAMQSLKQLSLQQSYQ